MAEDKSFTSKSLHSHIVISLSLSSGNLLHLMQKNNFQTFTERVVQVLGKGGYHSKKNFTIGGGHPILFSFSQLFFLHVLIDANMQ